MGRPSSDRRWISRVNSPGPSRSFGGGGEGGGDVGRVGGSRRGGGSDRGRGASKDGGGGGGGGAGASGEGSPESGSRFRNMPVNSPGFDASSVSSSSGAVRDVGGSFSSVPRSGRLNIRVNSPGSSDPSAGAGASDVGVGAGASDVGVGVCPACSAAASHASSDWKSRMNLVTTTRWSPLSVTSMIFPSGVRGRASTRSRRRRRESGSPPMKWTMTTRPVWARA